MFATNEKSEQYSSTFFTCSQLCVPAQRKETPAKACRWYSCPNQLISPARPIFMIHWSAAIVERERYIYIQSMMLAMDSYGRPLRFCAKWGVLVCRISRNYHFDEAIWIHGSWGSGVPHFQTNPSNYKGSGTFGVWAKTLRKNLKHSCLLNGLLALGDGPADSVSMGFWDRLQILEVHSCIEL